MLINKLLNESNVYIPRSQEQLKYFLDLGCFILTKYDGQYIAAKSTRLIKILSIKDIKDVLYNIKINLLTWNTFGIVWALPYRRKCSILTCKYNMLNSCNLYRINCNYEVGNN